MPQKNIILNVFKYNPLKDDRPKFETHEVPYVEGMRVLDLLNHVRENFDGSLSYRWECRAGQCGSCGMMINGKAGLACQTVVAPRTREIIVAPLPFFPVIKDLVVDVERGVKRLLKIRPYVHRDSSPKHPEIFYPHQIEEIKPLKECVECWCCISTCPVVQVAWDTYGGPIAMTTLAKVTYDRRNVFDHLHMAFLEGLNACTQCGSCKEVCPKEIDIPEKAVGKMRFLAYNKRGLLREGHKIVLDSLRTNFNPLKETAESRVDWVKGLDLPIAKRDGKVLYFVGCMASWREQVVARSTAALLKLAGIDFTILGPQERDCGSVLFRINDLELARYFALSMKDLLGQYGKIEMIVTSCAGCFRAFKKDYPEKLGIELGIPVSHSSEVFAECLDDGKISVKRELPLKATYHDPCHLGRHVGVYESPRKILKGIGVDLREMLNGKFKENSRCCGAGGGVRSGFREVAREVAAYRMDVDMPKDVDTIIHTCPFCYFNFVDAVELKGYPMKNVDLTELLLVSTMGPDAVKVIGNERYGEIMALVEKP